MAKNKRPSEIEWGSLGPTGGKPPGHLAKAKWAKQLRMRYEDYRCSNTPCASAANF